MGADETDMEPRALYAYYITPAVMDSLTRWGPDTVQGRVYREAVRCLDDWKPDMEHDSVWVLALGTAQVVERLRAAGDLKLIPRLCDVAVCTGGRTGLSSEAEPRCSSARDDGWPRKRLFALYWWDALEALGRNPAGMVRHGYDESVMDSFDRYLWAQCLADEEGTVVARVRVPGGSEAVQRPHGRLVPPSRSVDDPNGLAFLAAWVNAVTVLFIVYHLEDDDSWDLKQKLFAVVDGLVLRAPAYMR